MKYPATAFISCGIAAYSAVRSAWSPLASTMHSAWPNFSKSAGTLSMMGLEVSLKSMAMNPPTEDAI